MNYTYIRDHIEASAPCSLYSVAVWVDHQLNSSLVDFAAVIDALVAHGTIVISSDGAGAVIDLGENEMITGTLNIGLARATDVMLDAYYVQGELYNRGFILHDSDVRDSDSEPTLIQEFSIRVSEAELEGIVFALSEKLGQDCIAYQLTTGQGYLVGPRAHAWGGKFNPDYFMTL